MLLLLKQLLKSNRFNTACTLKINGDLTEPQPLLVKPNPNETVFEDTFYLPRNKDGLLLFTAGDIIDLNCPGSFLQRDSVNTHKEIVQAVCYRGSTFTVQNLKTDFDMLNCSNQAKHQARYTGRRCVGKKYREIEIGFKVSFCNLCYNPCTAIRPPISAPSRSSKFTLSCENFQRNYKYLRSYR